MRCKLVVFAAAGGLSIAGAAGAQSGHELLKSKGCMACHAADAKKAGPSFKDIAAKHKADARAADKLVEALKTGKGHPKTATATDAEFKAMVTTILASK